MNVAVLTWLKQKNKKSPRNEDPIMLYLVSGMFQCPSQI